MPIIECDIMHARRHTIYSILIWCYLNIIPFLFFLQKFRDSLKQELRLLKQEIDLQPKEKRKDEFRKRRVLMDVQHEDRERSFLSSLSENHELALRRLSEKHRDRLATIDKNFLQQKQTVSGESISSLNFQLIMKNEKPIRIILVFTPIFFENIEGYANT